MRQLVGSYRAAMNGADAIVFTGGTGQNSAKIREMGVYWNIPPDDLIRRLQSSAAGLTSEEASTRLTSYGANTLTIHEGISPLRIFFRQFKSPLALVLVFAAGISIFVGEWVDASVILAIVLGSAVITFVQEYSAGNAIAKLRKRLRRQASVLRDGKTQRVAVESVVPGDIVLLSAGSLIPADGIVVDDHDCCVDQAVLTGETFPVEKRRSTTDPEAGLAARSNCLFMGTSVRSGLATMLVVKTGDKTEYGIIAGTLAQQAPETEFQRGIRNFGLMLTRIIILLVIAVFAVNLVTNKPTLESLLFAIALAVGISPELLPAIITINLSKGARRMAKRGVIVRRLEAIENLGSMDVLCTDKTGTLTDGGGSSRQYCRRGWQCVRESISACFFERSLPNGDDQCPRSSDNFRPVNRCVRLQEAGRSPIRLYAKAIDGFC